ncbi:MAG: cyclodeaminase/cyclohydrolase family protein, partial [Solirubrobacteraceae bacterium]
MASLEELLEAVAERTPAPGGGAAAAWACALAASLAEMAGEERAAPLRALALELAERDMRAYAPVLEAQRSGSDPSAALSAAADSTIAIARAAAEVAGLAEKAATSGRQALRGDAVTGALLAEAACSAAVRLTELNLA